MSLLPLPLVERDRATGDSARASEPTADEGESKACCSSARTSGPTTTGRKKKAGGMVCHHHPLPLSAPRFLPAADQDKRRATAACKVGLLHQGGAIWRLPW